MVRTVEYENPVRVKLVQDLRKLAKEEEALIWNAVADRLSKSRRNRPEVNLYRIDKHTKEGDTIVVPGNVLGNSRLNHTVNVAAFNFSNAAKKSIEAAGGKVLTLKELMEKNSKGSGVKIIG